ncbi:MAG: hypothetical protein H0W20_11290 [Chthoniobacterales bacterium]|nr:hypothetical protein [Chthoniobacterales bacterium]
MFAQREGSDCEVVEGVFLLRKVGDALLRQSYQLRRLCGFNKQEQRFAVRRRLIEESERFLAAAVPRSQADKQPGKHQPNLNVVRIKLP